MTAVRGTVLVLGVGNPGRRDDGLGPALAERVAALGIPGVRAESCYQLGVEDAALAAEHDVVVFADAAIPPSPPFELRAVEPDESHRFTTHAMGPATVLAVARDVLGRSPDGWVLAIRGEDFDGFGEGLSHAAEANLRAAAEFLEGRLRAGFPARAASEG